MHIKFPTLHCPFQLDESRLGAHSLWLMESTIPKSDGERLEGGVSLVGLGIEGGVVLGIGSKFLLNRN